jgi:hypothetical protein
LLDLTDIYEANKDKLLAYPVEIGSYNGRVYGMSWQTTPGALFYRRSLAKKYLGTDDPTQVQMYLSDLPKFLEVTIQYIFMIAFYSFCGPLPTGVEGVNERKPPLAGSFPRNLKDARESTYRIPGVLLEHPA